jgi:hypothetical protein
MSLGFQVRCDLGASSESHDSESPHPAMVSSRGKVILARVTQTRATYWAALTRWASENRGPASSKISPGTCPFRKKVLLLGRSRSTQVWMTSGMGTPRILSATKRRVLASSSRPSIQACTLQKVFLPKRQTPDAVPA